MRNPELTPSQDGDASLRAGRCRHSGRGSDSRACPEECRSCLMTGGASGRSCQPLGIRSDRLAAQHVDSRRGHSASRMPLQCVGLSESLCSCRVSAGGSCQACLRQSCSVPGRGESATAAHVRRGPTPTHAAHSLRAWTRRARGALQMEGPWCSRDVEARVRTGSVPGRGCVSSATILRGPRSRRSSFPEP